MPPMGRRPKPEGQAVTRVPKQLDWVDVPNVKFAGGPKLPPAQADGTPWPPGIPARWKIWSSMPHCINWDDEDWAFAMDTLLVAARFVVSVEMNVASELRNREKVMGTTWDYRRNLRIRYVDPEPEQAAKVVGLDDFRNL